MVKVFRAVLKLINAAIILALLAIHFVVKERSYWSSLNFYTFPLPVIIAIVVLMSLLLSRKWRRYNLILAFLLLVIWMGRSFKVHLSENIKETDLEIVFWNASRDNNFEMAFHENENIPDVMVLVESKANDIDAFKTQYPNYYFYKSDREIFIFSKTPLDINSENTSNYNTTVINFKTAGVNFYAVDVTGSSDVPRAWELTYVNNHIANTKNTIVLGDFNVPYESKYLNNLKANFNQAFNKKGNGFRETWFYNLPILSLDHIWVSEDLKVLKTEKINTFKSDHSMLKTFIEK